MDLYYPHGIVLPSTQEITHLAELEPESGLDDLMQYSASSVTPGYTGSNFAEPKLNFESTQIKDLLDEMSVESVWADLSGGNTDLEWQIGSNFADRTSLASLAHLRARLASNACLWWESISADQDGTAVLRGVIEAISVGGAQPVTRQTGVALAITVATADLFTLGPIKVNGTFLDSVQSMTWSNNVQPDRRRTTGSPYAEYLGLGRISPELTIRTEDRAVIDDYDFDKGTALTALSCFLRKRDENGINVADVTAEHILLSATAGTIKVMNARELKIVIESFTINTTSAIS